MALSIQTVFGRIKEISERSVKNRPYISFEQLEQELGASRQYLNPILTELKTLRLIAFDQFKATSVKLTHLGENFNQI